MEVAASEFELMTLREVAQTLRVSEATIYRMTGRGELGVVRLNGRTLIEAKELRRIISERRAGGAAA